MDAAFEFAINGPNMEFALQILIRTGRTSSSQSVHRHFNREMSIDQ